MLRLIRKSSLRNCPRHSLWKAYRSRLRVEELEQRNCPSTLTPGQVRHAYGFDQAGFDGSGQTIAIVDAYYDRHIASDLQTFDKAYNLPATPLTQAVAQGAYSADATGWSVETALDVEWAHAIAPKANILLVEAHSSSIGDLMSAVDYARNQPGVTAVSMSWGIDEATLGRAAESFYDSYFTTPAGHAGITFVAASGDSGAASGPEWPAISPNVLSVGGTRLTTTGSSGDYTSESAWSGSGGGVSAYESAPSYQSSVQSTGKRTSPDVAYDADPQSGYIVYSRGWYSVGGTSAGAPQWAGLIALASQARANLGLGSLNGAQAALYSLPSTDFHDITT